MIPNFDTPTLFGRFNNGVADHVYFPPILEGGGVWFPCLVAWVVKSIVLKVGGSKLYEEWVVPFVGGFISGTAIEILLMAAASYVMFPPTL